MKRLTTIPDDACPMIVFHELTPEQLFAFGLAATAIVCLLTVLVGIWREKR